MAKNNDKKKKDSDNKKITDDKASRGRPSIKEEKNVINKKESLKAEDKKETKNNESVKPKLNETDLLIKEIYGNEQLKDAIPFPKSEQKTQTGGIIDEYNIDIQRLPQDILNLVNDFVSDFTTLTQNPMMVQLVATIIEKDTKASNALKEWAEPKKDKLITLKIKVKGGVSVVSDNTNTKTVIDASNINNVMNSMPSNNNTNTNANQPQVTHGQNPIIAREATGSYQHHIHSNPVSSISNNQPKGITENKQIHYEMLNKSNHFQDVHKQQNLQYVPEQIIPVSPQKYIEDYSKSIMDIINSTFQMLHWKYIPLSVLKGILSSADNTFGYEIVQGGNDYYINISRGNDKTSTPKFSVKDE